LQASVKDISFTSFESRLQVVSKSFASTLQVILHSLFKSLQVAVFKTEKYVSKYQT